MFIKFMVLSIDMRSIVSLSVSILPSGALSYLMLAIRKAISALNEFENPANVVLAKELGLDA